MHQPAVSVHERRRAPRFDVLDRLEVFDSEDNRRLGRVVDVSTQGLRTIGDDVVPPGLEFNIWIPLGPDHRRAFLEVRSQWSEPVADSSECYTGFELSNRTPHTIYAIRQVLREVRASLSQQLVLQ